MRSLERTGDILREPERWIMTTETQAFALDLRFRAGYEFAVDFAQPGVPDLVVDEHPPLGAGRGPNPARMLAVAVGHCLASSFLFCARKARIEVKAFAVQEPQRPELAVEEHVHGIE